MLLRDYRKLGNISLADMLAKLQAVADPGELERMRRSTILRHETGNAFPGARMQQLYILATDGAVRPEDWVTLSAAPANDDSTRKEGEYAKA